MDTGLFVDSVEQGRLVSSLGCQRGGKVEFQALGKIVVELELRLEDVGGGPGFGQNEAVLVVGVLGLDVTGDALRLGVAQTRDLEGDVGGGLGLDFQRGSEDGVVLGEQVVGRLSKVLAKQVESGVLHRGRGRIPSMRVELAGAETCWILEQRGGGKRKTHFTVLGRVDSWEKMTSAMSAPPMEENKRRPIYKTETTGNYWQDVWEACKVRLFRITLTACHVTAKE